MFSGMLTLSLNGLTEDELLDKHSLEVVNVEASSSALQSLLSGSLKVLSFSLKSRLDRSIKLTSSCPTSAM